MSDRIDGGARASVCRRSGVVCQAFFFGNPSCCTDVGGDESRGYFSAAACQTHHRITL